MKIPDLVKSLLAVLVALPLLAGGETAFAAKGPFSNATPGSGRMTPDLAAKREMVRKQQEQRITPEKRKAAVEALKAERLRVYEAKQYVKKHSDPSSNGNKK